MFNKHKQNNIQKSIFTNTEKETLKYIKNYNWIVRNKDGDICFYINKPVKLVEAGKWVDWSKSDTEETLMGFASFELEKIFLDYKDKLFSSIKWEDKEPCEFKKFLK